MCAAIDHVQCIAVGVCTLRIKIEVVIDAVQGGDEVVTAKVHLSWDIVIPLHIAGGTWVGGKG